MRHSPPNPPNMSLTPSKTTRVRPWVGLSPLAAKRHRLDCLDAEGHHSHRDDDLAPAPASSLATRFHRATSSTAEEQNNGREDVVVLPAVSAPAPTPAPALVPTPTPMPPLPPSAFVPAPAPAKRRRLDSTGGAEDEDRPAPRCRRVILRPPHPPLEAQLHHDAAHCQPGSSGNGSRASDLGSINAVFRDCWRMSPLDGDHGDEAEAAFLPKPSPGLQGPSHLLTGRTPSLAGPTLPPPPTNTNHAAGMQASLAALEAETQADCLALTKQVQGDKSTANTYQRHVTKYEAWWVDFQEKRKEENAEWTILPAFPITVSKVMKFLRCVFPCFSGSCPLNSLGKTEVKGGQAHHTPLSCWQAVHLTDNICP
jgi:hypothetical protein